MNTNKNNSRNGPNNSEPNNSSNDRHEDISADRLIEASTAALKAVVEIAETTGGPWPYPPDLMGSPMQPRILCDFTRAEIQEATDFLVRLGMLDAPKAKGRK
jgi:hypothetical protein